jgi:glycosylphosphatidylinositol transamidase
MALLTSDQSNESSSIWKQLNKRYALLCITLLSFSLSGFLLLPSEQIAERTYFSDNALLPGLVQRQFAGQQHIERYLQQLRLAAQTHGDRLPVALLTQLFSQLGLEAHEHNFTFTYPFGQRSKYHGRNVYAVLRAPRTAGTEAIVLSVPYRADLTPNGSSLPGLALLLSLAKYFGNKTYWAKDIVFLVYEHELIGCQAWLQAYHEVELGQDDGSNKSSDRSESVDRLLDSGNLAIRSGQIQAALNLEIHASLSSRLDIKVEGFNGQLPNLDFFNVAVELATRESATPTFHGRSHLFSGSHSELWTEHAKTLRNFFFLIL